MARDKVHNRYGTVLRRDDAAVLCSLDFAEKEGIKRICDKNKVVNRIKTTRFLNFIYILVHIVKVPGSFRYQVDHLPCSVAQVAAIPLSAGGRVAVRLITVL